jgi:hypothetical protein
MSTEHDQILSKSPLLRTVEGERLLALAEATEVNTVLTYERIRDEIGFDPQSDRGRQLWAKVQAELEARGLQFHTEPRVGYRRLDDDGKVDKSGRLIGQAAGRARKAGRVIASTDRAKLTDENKLKHDVQRVCVSMIETIARPATSVKPSPPPDPDELQRVFAGVAGLK